MNPYSIQQNKQDRSCDYCGERKDGIDKYKHRLSAHWHSVYLCQDCKTIVLTDVKKMKQGRTRDEWLQKVAKQ